MIPPEAVVDSDPPRVHRTHEIVTILVGESKQKFVADENLLCAASKFFRAALDKKWDKGQVKTVELGEETIAVFNVFIDWLNSGHFDTTTWSGPRTGIEWHPDDFWLKVYSFADRLIIPGLQLQALKQITSIFNSLLPTIPSVDCIQASFQQDGLKIIQEHLIGHVVYWMPKSEQPDIWVGLFSVHPDFTLGVASNVVAAAVREIDYTHPSDEEGFAAKQGLNVAELAGEARIADEKLDQDKMSKVLGLAQIKDKNKDASFGLHHLPVDPYAYWSAPGVAPRRKR
ncbi:hypothetical protein EDD36DRAFT_143579 [Exophiala viscosa]|uniref:BTB domain-containing protein n=1 Tax=Exophiala viscosa TaxID=2486360 RepID=A0AAN6IGJ1_9EURO|nr:hypothetical protein EDD36DRAFT_143579 [Exophiala viscosa]